MRLNELRKRVEQSESTPSDAQLLLIQLDRLVQVVEAAENKLRKEAMPHIFNTPWRLTCEVADQLRSARQKVGEDTTPCPTCGRIP